jgi:Dyp-type peroxidase family
MSTNYQAGIIDHPPEHALLVALGFVGSPAPAAALAAVQSLQELVHRELAADIDEITAQTNRGAAFPESSELGVTDGYDTRGLTITFGISASGMTMLGVPAAQMPQDLIPVPWSRFSDSPTNPNNGDLVLQVCSDSAYLIEHVLRRIEVNLSSIFSIQWTLLGEQRYGMHRDGPPTADLPRAIIGFNDGLSNLDPTSPSDLALVFVDPSSVSTYPTTPPAGQQPGPAPGQPGYGTGGQGPIFPDGLRNPPANEPTWTAGGSYMFVRASTINTGTWDQSTLGSQEAAVGRWKDSGATLDNPDQTAHRMDAPQFASNPRRCRRTRELPHSSSESSSPSHGCPKKVLQKGFSADLCHAKWIATARVGVCRFRSHLVDTGGVRSCRLAQEHQFSDPELWS